MKDFNYNRAVNDKRVHRNNGLTQAHLHNKLNRDYQPTDEESMEYIKGATNRQQAQALLNKLKQKEVFVSKVFWKDGQPTLVESTSEMQGDRRLIKMGFTRPETKGLPATSGFPSLPVAN